ncbi:hypothetical protein [Flavobacterium sp. ZS1P14]|uniref:hypothetical protein n=1 Tax=Flavobacterium sp. ZS1P14 TaxID=3401729 RepID=UPI003AAC553F
MKKTINIPKINIVTFKKKEKINFPGHPIDPPIEYAFNKNDHKLIFIQRMFQNKRTNW